MYVWTMNMDGGFWILSSNEDMFLYNGVYQVPLVNLKY